MIKLPDWTKIAERDFPNVEWTFVYHSEDGGSLVASIGSGEFAIELTVRYKSEKEWQDTLRNVYIVYLQQQGLDYVTFGKNERQKAESIVATSEKYGPDPRLTYYLEHKSKLMTQFTHDGFHTAEDVRTALEDFRKNVNIKRDTLNSQEVPTIP